MISRHDSTVEQSIVGERTEVLVDVLGRASDMAYGSVKWNDKGTMIRTSERST